MLIIIGRNNFERAVSELHKDVMQKVEGELAGIKSVADLSKRVKQLREQVEALEMEKGRKEEEFARKEREIEHKVGLERKRQEFELASGKREATLTVREENLSADRKRFEEQMKFHDDRFTQEVGYLKTMVSEMLARLPAPVGAAAKDED